MPPKVRKGRIHPVGGGPSVNAQYYPRSDGGYVAETGKFAGKRVAKRDMGKDQKQRAKTKSPPARSGYGQRTDSKKRKKR